MLSYYKPAILTALIVLVTFAAIWFADYAGQHLLP